MICCKIVFEDGLVQPTLYHQENDLLRSKTLQEVEHYIEFGEFSDS